jgi:type VI secretion system protein VasG
LRNRIKGQDHAIDAIAKAATAAYAGLDSPTRPTGIFLFVGPSGVGKTETALAVADELYGGERMLISINMSEFQEKHTVSRLIGSPPGYVGYGEGGRLTEAVRRQPYSAVLFDEVEKAHPDVLNLFYQVFDKGILADGEGREVDFRNTMIFMTSNLGSDIVSAMFEDGESPAPEAVLETIRPTLAQFFRPALLGRMTIVPFMPISPDILKELVAIKFSQVGERLRVRHRMELSWNEDVVGNIAASCTAVDTGARNIDHVINANLLPGIATALLGSLSENGPEPTALRIELDAGTGKIVYTMHN